MIERSFVHHTVTVGSVLTLLICAAGYLLFSPQAALGVLIGGSIALLNLQGLEKILGWSFQLDTGSSAPSKGSTWIALLSFFVRYGLIVILLGVMAFFHWIHFPGLIVGLTVGVFSMAAVIVARYNLFTGHSPT